MISKEALYYIKNHSVWYFAAIHGWIKPDEKLFESFSAIQRDLEVLDILKTNIVNCIGDTSGQEYYKLILHKFNNEENFEKVNKWLKN